MSYNLDPRPSPAPLSREQVVSLSRSFCVPQIELTAGRRGEEPNHATARKPVVLLSIIFNTLSKNSGVFFAIPRKNGISYKSDFNIRNSVLAELRFAL
jgi:hypothetical protein